MLWRGNFIIGNHLKTSYYWYFQLPTVLILKRVEKLGFAPWSLKRVLDFPLGSGRGGGGGGRDETRKEMVSQSSPLDHVAARGVIFVAAAFFAAAGSSPSAFAFPFEDAGNNRRETLTKYFPSGDTGML